MKNKLKLFILGLATLSLSACNFSLDMFNFSDKSGVTIIFDTTRSEITLKQNQSFTLRATYTPEDYEPESITWGASVEGVVDVIQSETNPMQAKVTGVAPGTTNVTVTVDKKKASMKFIVPEGELETLELEGFQTMFEVGDEFVYGGKVTATYSNNATKDVTSEATFTGYDMSKDGPATVTVSYTDKGITASKNYDITVYKKGEMPVIEKTTLDYTYSDLQHNSIYTVDSCPSVGKGKLLVIPVWFTNSTDYIPAAKKDAVRDDIRKAYFGTNEETGWRSVKTFYEEESHNVLSLEGTVAPWYECGKPSSSFYTGTNTTVDLVKKATDWYFSLSDAETRTSFDCDGNGFLDGVMLIYAAPDMQAERNESHDNMWAYCYWVQVNNASKTKPTPNVYFWASYDFMYGSTYKIGDYYNGDTSHCNIDAHTFIHEMGHVFGLDDYYDYAGKYKDAGAFTMQDYNVGGHDPFSVMALGWAQPYVPTETIDITLKPFQSSGDCILLSSNFQNSPFDEYLLLDLYTPTGLNKFDTDYTYDNGYPRGINDYGIRVWHVNDKLAKTSGYTTTFTSKIVSGNKYYEAISNTSDPNNGHVPLAEYAKYSQLTLLNKEAKSAHRNTEFSKTDLWKTGDKFAMDTHAKLFVNNGKLDWNNDLGWKFEIVSVSSTSAVVRCTKL